ncbi:MFS transporter [Alicyclobacillus curvatus]|nr:MFS transporter [Alicyclobacillus curvatus]
MNGQFPNADTSPDMVGSPRKDGNPHMDVSPDVDANSQTKGSPDVDGGQKVIYEVHLDEYRQSARAVGRRNLVALYGYTATSRLWFDGSLWLIYWQVKGISLFDIGLLEAILHVVCLFVDVPIGIFADRYGWKLSLLASGVFGVVYSVLSLIGHNFLFAALAFAARGVQSTFVNGSDAALAYESARIAGEQERYQRISGRMMAIMLVSMAVAEAAGGALANWSWNAIYIAIIIAHVVSMTVTLFISEPRGLKDVKSAPREESNASRESALTVAKDAIRFAKSSPLFLRWLLFSAVLSGFLATFSFYGQSLLLHSGWSLVGIGILSGFENGFGAVMALSSDRVTRYLGERRTAVVTAFIGGLGLTLFAFVPGVASGVGYLTGSAGGNLADPLIDRKLNDIIPTRQRATLLSANSTAFSLFMIVVFPLFGLLSGRLGLIHAAEIWSVIGVCLIIASALAVRSPLSKVDHTDTV